MTNKNIIIIGPSATKSNKEVAKYIEQLEKRNELLASIKFIKEIKVGLSSKKGQMLACSKHINTLLDSELKAILLTKQQLEDLIEKTFKSITPGIKLGDAFPNISTTDLLKGFSFLGKPEKTKIPNVEDKELILILKGKHAGTLIGVKEEPEINSIEDLISLLGK